MIRLANTGPIPGNFSNSFAVARLMLKMPFIAVELLRTVEEVAPLTFLST